MTKPRVQGNLKIWLDDILTFKKGAKTFSMNELPKHLKKPGLARKCHKRNFITPIEKMPGDRNVWKILISPDDNTKS
jgi:hypothetical protein